MSQLTMIHTNRAFLNFIENQLTEAEKKDRVFLQSWPAGSHLLKQGQGNKYVFVQQTGLSKVHITEDNGKDFIVQFLGEGELLGEIEVIQKTPNLTTVTALTAVTAWCITTDYFAYLITHNAELNRLLLLSLAHRLNQTSARASYQQVYPAEYAMLKLLSVLATQQTSFAKKDLADYLGVSVRSFNRSLKQLRERSIVHPDSFDLYIERDVFERLMREYGE
ncbi:Crp/Fnr family transcriptional regulator [Chitinophaga varians]|uniref:Crp/Fnr family transcriptional regulator n=1 Tax=Chitinophaga varians TaxID=2202339 RepID=UPI00165F0A12|nr:Crp/Fnr family transcriptional regulator [Chitinophaga varians]MBC9911917.1 Crp/Fnr family transcriptional regulator [Chitinophaga varians]